MPCCCTRWKNAAKCTQKWSLFGGWHLPQRKSMPMIANIMAQVEPILQSLIIAALSGCDYRERFSIRECLDSGPHRLLAGHLEHLVQSSAANALPGVFTSITTDQNVSHLDISPTFCSLRRDSLHGTSSDAGVKTSAGDISSCSGLNGGGVFLTSTCPSESHVLGSDRPLSARLRAISCFSIPTYPFNPFIRNSPFLAGLRGLWAGRRCVGRCCKDSARHGTMGRRRL